MIPKFIDIGSIWEVLPPRIHDATLKEIEQRFAITERRLADELLKNTFRSIKKQERRKESYKSDYPDFLNEY